MKKAILLGPCVGEFFWEFFRFAPLLPNLRLKKYKDSDITYIVLTRKERFDIYGRLANILVPLQIPGDFQNKWGNCYKLMGLKLHEYLEIGKIFRKKYGKKYHIIDHFYPDIKKPVYCSKNQYAKSQMTYKWFPRLRNEELVDMYLPKNKPLVVLSPRYRGDLKRNWPHWETFFDMVANDLYLMKHFHFILCGKEGEYIPDKQKRFLDLNDIQLDEDSSLAGVLLATMSRAFFTFGSQSAIPNISLLYGVEALEFGNQKTLHTVTYNVKRTPVTFVNDYKYNIAPKVIFNKFKQLLQQKQQNPK
jgi:hypothetical protein